MTAPVKALSLFALLFLVPLAPAFSQGARADDKDVIAKDVIDYRRHVMNTLNEQSGALGMILSTAIPSDNAAAHLEALALAASLATKAFEPKVPGGEARPEVWTKWPDFSKRMNEFAAKTAAAARTAREKSPDAALANILDALTCKACHDLYRDENKK